MFNKKVKKIVENYEGDEARANIGQILNPIFEKNYRRLSKEELNFCLIEELECEVNSGGFNSYFYYSYGNHAVDTLNALKEIGSIKFYDILKRAIGVFGNEDYPTKEEIRSDIIDDKEVEFDSTWDGLDDEFYKYEEDIIKLMLDYVKENIKKFR